MKKYKLKDLVLSGSNARRKIDSDVIIGDISLRFGYGDILDANSSLFECFLINGGNMLYEIFKWE